LYNTIKQINPGITSQLEDNFHQMIDSSRWCGLLCWGLIIAAAYIIYKVVTN